MIKTITAASSGIPSSISSDDHPLLSIKSISYAYKDGSELRFILKNISYNFDLGCFYAIMGSSGSGKTTLLSIMGALDVPRSGSVFCQGKNIEMLGYDNYRRNKIGMVFQNYSLIPWLTAIENVALAMYSTDNKVPANHYSVSANLLDYLGIDNNRAKRRVPELSGGEQQRVAIARSLATNAVLILADEPTGNLDEKSSEEIIQIFRQLAHVHNRCVIVVTHDSEIASMADKVLLLTGGELKEGIEPAILTATKG